MGKKGLSTALSLSLVCLSVLAQPSFAQAANTKIDSNLIMLEKIYKEKGKSAAAAFAADNKIELKSGKAAVLLVTGSRTKKAFLRLDSITETAKKTKGLSYIKAAPVSTLTITGMPVVKRKTIPGAKIEQAAVAVETPVEPPPQAGKSKLPETPVAATADTPAVPGGDAASFTPTTNRTGPGLPPGYKTKPLPAFTPVTNRTGPVKK